MPSAVFYDLEFTAWEGAMQGCWLAPGQFREVVQIGAVQIGARSLIAGLRALVARGVQNPLRAIA